VQLPQKEEPCSLMTAHWRKDIGKGGRRKYTTVIPFGTIEEEMIKLTGGNVRLVCILCARKDLDLTVLGLRHHSSYLRLQVEMFLTSHA
jgi:hypothetical protein